MSSFVSRTGSKLYVDDAEFKAVGPNGRSPQLPRHDKADEALDAVYWLGLDENIASTYSYPTQNRVLVSLGESRLA